MFDFQDFEDSYPWDFRCGPKISRVSTCFLRPPTRSRIRSWMDSDAHLTTIISIGAVSGWRQCVLQSAWGHLRKQTTRPPLFPGETVLQPFLVRDSLKIPGNLLKSKLVSLGSWSVNVPAPALIIRFIFLTGLFRSILRRPSHNEAAAENPDSLAAPICNKDNEVSCQPFHGNGFFQSKGDRMGKVWDSSNST